MDYKYNIEQFYWNKEANTFYADAWDLVCILPDGTIHPEAFPSGKEQFFIRNYKTGGFRRFRFVKPTIDYFSEVKPESDSIEFELHSWLFESEDGIKCSIFYEII